MKRYYWKQTAGRSQGRTCAACGRPAGSRRVRKHGGPVYCGMCLKAATEAVTRGTAAEAGAHE